MPIAPKRLPFFDHIAELRKRLMIVALSLMISSTVLYAWSPQIYDFILAPATPFLPSKPVIFGPFEAFTFRFKVALFAALVLCSPIIIWQVLAFFLPALKPKEQRYFIPTFFVALLLFLAGNVFCYTVILGKAMEWMIGQAGTAFEVLPSAPMFLSGITLLLLGFGIAFELPVVIFYLVAFNIVPYAKLRSNWRIAYVTLMIVASIATPDWSPVTMGALFAALLALYEASLLMARLLFNKRIAAQRLADNDDDDDKAA